MTTKARTKKSTKKASKKHVARGVKVRPFAKGKRVSAIGFIRAGIRDGLDDAQIVKMVRDKFPKYSEKRIPVDLRWHRNPKHADDLRKGMQK